MTMTKTGKRRKVQEDGSIHRVVTVGALPMANVMSAPWRGLTVMLCAHWAWEWTGVWALCKTQRRRWEIQGAEGPASHSAQRTCARKWPWLRDVSLLSPQPLRPQALLPVSISAMGTLVVNGDFHIKWARLVLCMGDRIGDNFESFPFLFLVPTLETSLVFLFKGNSTQQWLYPFNRWLLRLLRNLPKVSWLVSETRRFIQVSAQAYPNSRVHALNREPYTHFH